MNTTNNYILITIDSEFEDKISGPESKLNLDLATFKTNIVDKNDDVIYAVNQHKRNYGTVIGVPAKLTEDVKLYQLPIGPPEPLRHIDHDTVKRVGVKYLKYECGTYEPTWKTAADIKMDVLIGDKIYFHFNTLEAENRINLLDGRKVYKLGYQNALCVVRYWNIKRWENGKGASVEAHSPNKRQADIISIGGRVLIEPAYDEDVQKLEDGKMGKLSSSGLVTEIDNKPKYLEGIVRYISLLKDEETELEPGDRIIYQKNSDWTVSIEGRDYYCMRTIDIEAKILSD